MTQRFLRTAATFAVAALIGGLSAVPLAALDIKLATLVPDGSVWDDALAEMGADWSDGTDGRVRLRIYPGGVAGDERDVVRKMRIGQLQAGTLTTTGLAEIDPAFQAFGLPMIVDSYDELAAVLETVGPELKKRLEAKGFILIHWGHGGWTHLFSKNAIRDTASLKDQKLFVWAGDDALVQQWRRQGFQPVPLAATDILTGLQTGLIEALPTTPLAALSLQWFRQAPYMLGVPMAPLVGATVISKPAWNKLSEADRAVILAAAKNAESRLATEVPEQDGRAIEEMKKRGLKVVDAPTAEWRDLAERFSNESRKRLAEPGMFDRILAARDAYRAEAAD